MSDTTEEPPASLGEALPAECARVRELKAVYESLPGGAGTWAASRMELALKAADKAMVEGDLPAMIGTYRDLRRFE